MAHYNVGLSTSSDDLRFGYSNQKTYTYSQSRDSSIIKGINNTILLVNKYNESYNSVNNKDVTFLHQKDLMMSIALAKFIRCTQTKDSGYEVLTPHATEYWKLKSAYRNIWGQVPSDYLKTNRYYLPNGYYGPAGSLAFYLFQSPLEIKDLSPLDILQTAIEYFWAQIGVNPDISFRLKHQNCLSLIGVSVLDFNIYIKALNYIWNNPNIHPIVKNIVLELRALNIDLNDFNNLKQKFIFTEVDINIVKALERLQTFINNRNTLDISLPSELDIPNINPNVFNTIYNNCLNFAKPGGMALIYQVISIESLVKACRYINDLPLNISTSKYYDYIKYAPDRNVVLSLASYFATMYDSYAALAYLNTFYEARGLSYFAFQKAVELINYDANLTIPFDNNNEYRLTNFI